MKLTQKTNILIILLTFYTHISIPNENISPCQPIQSILPEKITTEIAIGELIDKITILQIKSEHIKDSEKLKNIHAELESLLQTLEANVPQSKELEELTKKLLDINRQLWKIEDAIRDKERKKCFDSEFIELARSVYYTNDERCKVKKQINDISGSRLQEEKSYTAY